MLLGNLQYIAATIKKATEERYILATSNDLRIIIWDVLHVKTSHLLLNFVYCARTPTACRVPKERAGCWRLSPMHAGAEGGSASKLK